MNLQAIYHRPESNYCFAVSPTKLTLRIRFAKGEKLDSVAVLHNTKYDIASKQFKSQMPLAFSDGLFDYYSVTLDLSDRRIAYVFEITVNNAVKYFCEDGLIDGYDFDIAYFNSFQFAYIHDSDVVKQTDWLTNAVFYQIFTDRFYKPLNKQGSYINSQWGELPTPKSFYGGDLNGIREKLPYIKSLNVTALYLTPIFESESNHKYDTIDYYKVDEMFGGNAALTRLVDECHATGLKVVLDAVFNHVSEKFAPFKDVIAKGKKSKYYNWFVINGDTVDETNTNYATFAACKYMPKLNTDNPEVQQYFVDIALFYMEKYSIDGWRLDVSDEVSHSFWRKFRNAVKTKNSDCVLIGENWHNSESFLNGDQFDSIMNYAVTKQMMDFWVYDSIDAQTLACRLNAQFARYNDVVNSMMFNLLDCHDTHRFYSLLNCSKDKLLCAIAIMVFIPGSFNLYYGTEVLTEGGYDPDSRRTFDWDKLNTPVIVQFVEKLKQLLALKRQPALKDGTVKVYNQDGLFVIERKTDNQTLRLKVAKKAVSAKADGIIKYNAEQNFGDNSFSIEIDGRLL